MDYQSLFSATDFRRGGDFRSLFQREPGKIDLRNPGQYLMLFVLEGSLDIHFTHQQPQHLHRDQLIAVDQTSIADCSCTEPTVLLEYTVPERLASFLGHSSQAFSTACSTIIPILPPLREWIDNLLTHYLPADFSKEENHMQRRMLATTLMQYPRSMLGELFVPFFVCAHGGCELCRNQGGGQCAI